MTERKVYLLDLMANMENSFSLKDMSSLEQKTLRGLKGSASVNLSSLQKKLSEEASLPVKRSPSYEELNTWDGTIAESPRSGTLSRTVLSGFSLAKLWEVVFFFGLVRLGLLNNFFFPHFFKRKQQ